MFYGVISECCTQQSCLTMSAGPTYVLSTLRPTSRPMAYRASCTGRLNYTWINQDRKSVQLPAPTYIDYVMTWVQNLLDDESTFPTKSGMSIIAISKHRNVGSHFAAPVYQDKTSLLLFHQPSSTFTVSSCVCLRTYTMHTTLKSFTCVPNPTSTRSLHTSWHLAVSTSCLTSKTYEASQIRQLASALYGSAGEKWVSLSRDPRTKAVGTDLSFCG